jgi:hypothetical protein
VPRSTLRSARRAAPALPGAAAALLLVTAPAPAERTVGLFQRDADAHVSYTLYSTLTHTGAYLFDVNGQLVNSWSSAYVPGNSLYLLPDGDLLRTADPGGNPIFLAGGDAGLVERFGWDGGLEWSFLSSNDDHRAHHDVAPLPNGNVLVLAWELRTREQAIAAGRNPALLGTAVWPEHVVEVEPDGATGGTIVWEWHVWDHLVQDFDATKDNFGVVADHPELIDVNHNASTSGDWMHANAIDFNAELDQILICSPFFGEFWIIDHSTTTAEAAGHTGGKRGRGGDILYRWGNPQAYDRGGAGDRKLFNQHNAHWIAPGLSGAGNILVFNNGAGRPGGSYSSIDELTTPVDGDGDYVLAPGAAYGPEDLAWTYVADPPSSFFSSFISGCQRLPNGHTFVCSGAFGEFFEVRPDGTRAWFYRNPVTTTGPVVQGTPVSPTQIRAFRAERYPPDFPGFVGRDLTPRGTIEIVECPGDVDCDEVVGFDDLLMLLAEWGQWSHADIDGSGVTDFGDLLLVLAAWGDCP